ncbi:hypothetical protein [Duganella radicis]|uniref:Uncharacterized protein n=1 Tax=Duganella radicis TaxID=551988 RepID=A0A6L6PRI3_9BURK|nr:hypothetical protein [Duganella radicis]MTV41746.1 hypothetical protein [Duganella radicis]
MSENSKPAAPAGALRLEDMSDAQLHEMVARAATDPFTARAAQQLQKQAFERMSESVQRMLAELNSIDKKQGKLTGGPVSVLALAGAARQREAAGKQKREFAEYLVIGAMVNRDNPDWNIFDESTAAATPAASGLMALLRMRLSAPAAAAVPSA